MFSELPKLFDRNFVIAYFLPTCLLFIGSAVLLQIADFWAIISFFSTKNTLVDVSIAIFSAWIVSVLLMVLNRDIYRILEGYGNLNPLRVFEKYSKQEFEKKSNRLIALDKLYRKKKFAAELEEERANLMEELAQRYPDKSDFILPTTFGNTLRAFEVYPRVMYGLEAIDGWPRILTVVPKEYQELVENAKTQVDWWVNLCVTSLLFLIEFWIIVYFKWSQYSLWYYTALNVIVPLIIFFFLNWIFMWRAISAAIGWGEYVKSAFDTYRFELLDLLGITHPTNRDKEKELWENFSQAIIFRFPDTLPNLKKQNNLDPSKKKKPKKKS